MMVRVTSFRVDPSRSTEAEARNEDISSGLRQIPGLLHAYTAHNDDGEGVVVGIWESEQAANDAASSIAQAWSKLADFMTSPPQAKVYHTAHQLK